MINDSYFNISAIKLSITSLFSVNIMSFLGASDIVYSDVIDSFSLEILNYEMSVIVSSTEKPQPVLFTPDLTHVESITGVLVGRKLRMGISGKECHNFPRNLISL